MSTEIAKVADNFLDFDEILKKAATLFKDQLFLNKEPSTLTLKDIEVAKAKSQNLLDALVGFVELHHHADIIAASAKRFKRSDELDVLNSLRESCAASSESLKGSIKLASMKHEQLMARLEQNADSVDASEIGLLQAILEANVDVMQKLVASFSRLVHLERLSGNRPWAAGKTTRTNISYIDGLDSSDDGGKAHVKPRELTQKDLAKLLQGGDDE